MVQCLLALQVHREVSLSMTTDSFIHVLRSLIARRGNVRQIRSDTGPNLAGAEQGLIHAFNEMYQTKILGFLQNNNVDWIQWKRNPPAASHMDGIWERKIRSTIGILASLMQTHGHNLMKNLWKHPWLKRKQLSIHVHRLWRQSMKIKDLNLYH